MAIRNFSERERIIDSEVPEGYQEIKTVGFDGPYMEGAILKQLSVIKAKTSNNDKLEVWICFDDGPLAGKAIREQYSLLKQENLDKLKDDMRVVGALEDKAEGTRFNMDDEEIISRMEGCLGIPVFMTDTFNNELKSKLAWPGFLPEDEAQRWVPKQIINQQSQQSTLDEEF